MDPQPGGLTLGLRAAKPAAVVSANDEHGPKITLPDPMRSSTIFVSFIHPLSHQLREIGELAESNRGMQGSDWSGVRDPGPLRVKMCLPQRFGAIECLFAGAGLLV